MDVFEELRHEFPEERCPLIQEFELHNKAQEGEDNIFEAELELPWGDIRVQQLLGIPQNDKEK